MEKSSWTAMRPRQLGDRRQPGPHSLSGQKVQLIYKLFLLGHSRKTLERELVNFTNKAYEEVQGLFGSTCCAGVLSDLSKALDFKCHVIDKVSALLKELAVDSHINLNNEANTSQCQPFESGARPATEVLNNGLVLHSSLTNNSITRAAQVCAAVVPLKQQRPAPAPPLPALIQLDDTACRSAPSNHSDDAAANVAPRQDASKRVESVGKRRSQVDPLPAVIHSPEVVRKEETRPEGRAEVTGHGADRRTPLGWASAEDVRVQHQKQTSSQLLHFLKAKGKSADAPEVTVVRQRNESATHFSTAFRFEPVATGLPKEARAPQTLSACTEGQIPVFKVKRAESGGSLIYSYVTATRTELWDIGDIPMEAAQADGGAIPSEAAVEDARRAGGQRGQSLQNAGAERVGDPAPVRARTTDGLTIPEFQFPKFEETKVVVSHIVNPGHFYIQQADSAVKLQALVTDSWQSSSSYAEQNCIPDIGTKVMGWFAKQEQWCRAQVTKMCGVSTEPSVPDCSEGEASIQVEVKRLDYGDAACLPLRSIKELTPAMTSLPLQAVQVSLANVVPVNGSEWSEVSVAWLRTMVHNRILYGRLYPKGPKVTVELFLERGRLGAMRRGASVSVRLAQNGHARHSKLRDVALVRKSAAEEKRRRQDAEWEKYLIGRYAQSRK